MLTRRKLHSVCAGRVGAVPTEGRKNLSYKLIKVCVFPPRALWRLPPPQKPRLYRGAKCLEDFVKVVSIFKTFEGWDPRWYFSLTTATEDNKRAISVWAGVRKKSRRWGCFVAARRRRETKWNGKTQCRHGVWVDESDVSRKCQRQCFAETQAIASFYEKGWGLFFLLFVRKQQSKCQGLWRSGNYVYQRATVQLLQHFKWGPFCSLLTWRKHSLNDNSFFFFDAKTYISCRSQIPA